MHKNCRLSKKRAEAKPPPSLLEDNDAAWFIANPRACYRVRLASLGELERFFKAGGLSYSVLEGEHLVYAALRLIDRVDFPCASYLFVAKPMPDGYADETRAGDFWTRLHVAAVRRAEAK